VITRNRLDGTPITGPQAGLQELEAPAQF
jgi:hypothetical protein